MIITHYIALTENGYDPISNIFWPLPTQSSSGTWTPGEWLPEVIDEDLPDPYRALTDLKSLLFYLQDGPIIAQVEFSGATMTTPARITGSKARLLRLYTDWTEQTARLFACDCASHVLYLLHAKIDSTIPAQSLALARGFAKGQVTMEELESVQASLHAVAQDLPPADVDSDTVEQTAFAATEALLAVDATLQFDGSSSGNAGHYARLARSRVAGEAWGKARENETDWQLERLRFYLHGNASPNK